MNAPTKQILSVFAIFLCLFFSCYSNIKQEVNLQRLRFDIPFKSSLQSILSFYTPCQSSLQIRDPPPPPPPTQLCAGQRPKYRYTFSLHSRYIRYSATEHLSLKTSSGVKRSPVLCTDVHNLHCNTT